MYPTLCSDVLCVTSFILRGRNCYRPHLTPEKTETHSPLAGTTEPASGRRGIRTQVCATPKDMLQAITANKTHLKGVRVLLPVITKCYFFGFDIEKSGFYIVAKL